MELQQLQFQKPPANERGYHSKLLLGFLFLFPYMLLLFFKFPLAILSLKSVMNLCDSYEASIKTANSG